MSSLRLHAYAGASAQSDEPIALKDGSLLASGAVAEMMRPRMPSDIYGIPMTTLPHPHGGATPVSFAL